jgi:hypothetical protein
LGAGGAPEAAREGDWWASGEAPRLRSASAAEEEEEPGRRRVRVRAVSSKSSPEAGEDSVELRSVSADMAAGALVSFFLLCSGRRRRIRRSLPLLLALCGRQRRWSRRQAGYSSSHRSPAVKGHDGTTHNFTHQLRHYPLFPQPPLRFEPAPHSAGRLVIPAQSEG